MIIYLNQEEVAKRNLIGYIESSSNELPSKGLQQNDDVEIDIQVDEEVDEEEAINEISFVDHPDDNYEEPINQFDCSDRLEFTENYMDSIENKVIEVVDLN